MQLHIDWTKIVLFSKQCFHRLHHKTRLHSQILYHIYTHTYRCFVSYIISICNIVTETSLQFIGNIHPNLLPVECIYIYLYIVALKYKEIIYCIRNIRSHLGQESRLHLSSYVKRAFICSSPIWILNVMANCQYAIISALVKYTEKKKQDLFILWRK